MKVNSLYPIIVTAKLEESVAYYKDLFEYDVKHNITSPEGIRVVILENENGQAIELIETTKNAPIKMKVGMHGFRMNVKDMKKAIAELQKKGASIVAGPIETESSINLAMKDINGANITLIQHKGRKKGDYSFFLTI